MENENKEKSNRKIKIMAALKIMLFSILSAFAILMVGALVGNFTDSVSLMLLAMLFAFAGIMFLLAFIYPIWFKAYKKYYDNKVLEEENEKANSTDTTKTE